MIRGTAGLRKRGREQGPKDDMAECPTGPEPAVERCALLPLGDGQALLHVAARWAPAAPDDVALLSSGPRSPHAPVAPGARIGDDGLWSASFAIAADAADGRLLLATPAEGPWPLPRPEPAEPKVAEAEPTTSEAEAQAEGLRRRCEATERTLAEVREKMVKAWSETAEMREILAAREAEHTRAARRWATSDQIVADLEARLEASERELSERRAALEAECARLRDELDRRRREGTREAGALKAEAAQARAAAADALANFEQARDDADSLRARLTEARTLADATLTAAAAASRELTAERARAAEAAQLAEEQAKGIAALDEAATAARTRAEAAEDTNRLLGAELEETRAAVAEAEAARARIAELEAARAEAEARADAAMDEAAQLAAQLDDLHASVETTVAETEAAAHAKAERAEARAQAAAEAVAAADARTNAASAEAAVLRERIESAERAAAEAAKAADEIREERDRLRAKLGEPSGATIREGGRRRSKVSARIHQETLGKLEVERARAEATEAQLATTREELDELRAQLEAQPGPELQEVVVQHTIDPDVEADLRHLLAMRQRELDELRAALNEQRARYAAVASQLTPHELAETSEEPEERPWTALDGDLLDRLTRAKQLTNED